MQGRNVKDHRCRPPSLHQPRSSNKLVKNSSSYRPSSHVHPATGKTGSSLYSKYARPSTNIGLRTPPQRKPQQDGQPRSPHHVTVRESARMTVLGDLSRLRRLFVKRGRELSHKENVELIRTLQKVKELSVSSARVVGEAKKSEEGSTSTPAARSSSSPGSGSSEPIIEEADPPSEAVASSPHSHAAFHDGDKSLDRIREEFLQSLHHTPIAPLRVADDSYLPAACKLEAADGNSQRRVFNGLKDSFHSGRGWSDGNALCFDPSENGSVLEGFPSDVFYQEWTGSATTVRVDHARPEGDEDVKRCPRRSISVDNLLLGRYNPDSHNVSNNFLPNGHKRSETSSQNQETVGSSSHCPIQPEPSHRSLVRGDTGEVYQTLDRRLEKERRVRTVPAATRSEPKGMFGEDFPPVEASPTRNGFRPGSRHPYFQRNEHPLISTSYRYGNPKDYGVPLSSISGSGGGTSTIQGHRVGIASRGRQTTKQPASSRNARIRDGFSFSATAAERSKGFLYPDAASGAVREFQDRLTQIANLENDTVRYEKTRKVKKKAKQEK